MVSRVCLLYLYIRKSNKCFFIEIKVEIYIDKEFNTYEALRMAMIPLFLSFFFSFEGYLNLFKYIGLTAIIGNTLCPFFLL